MKPGDFIYTEWALIGSYTDSALNRSYGNLFFIVDDVPPYSLRVYCLIKGRNIMISNEWICEKWPIRIGRLLI